MKELRVSEAFYSIQGEGVSAGMPAVFLRLGGCVLQCVFCDTTEVWSKWEKYTVEELVRVFKRDDYTHHLNEGAHLVVTGGDPLMQQEALVEFLRRIEENTRGPIHTEIETEGVLVPTEALANGFVEQWNVSPKLANSGMPEKKRLKRDVLEWHNHTSNSWFKFVVASEEDAREALKIVADYGLEHEKVMFMPQAASRKEMAIMAPLVVDLCKRFHVRYSPRLHIDVWDKATGV